MSRVYDNWERLVEATLKRELLREIALCPSFSSSSSIDLSSSFDSLDFSDRRKNSISSEHVELDASSSQQVFGSSSSSSTGAIAGRFARLLAAPAIALSHYQRRKPHKHFFDDPVVTETHNVDPRNHSNPLENVNKVEPPQKVLNSLSQWRAPQHRKNHIDSGDFIPEPRQILMIYTEIEKRLKMRETDEQYKDLRVLKKILEALQLKGLLHTRKPLEQNHRNYVYNESLIGVMKPSRFSTPSPSKNRTGNVYSPSSGGVCHAGEILPPVSPRRDRNVQS